MIPNVILLNVIMKGSRRRKYPTSCGRILQHLHVPKDPELDVPCMSLCPLGHILIQDVPLLIEIFVGILLKIQLKRVLFSRYPVLCSLSIVTFNF